MWSFLGMYVFQFIGHVEHAKEEHHDNDCTRCTGVNLYYKAFFPTTGKWEKPIEVFIEDNDGMWDLR